MKYKSLQKGNKVNKVYIIGEIGINHNGDLDIAKKLIDVAVSAGCDAVKFQKRDINTVYSAEVQAQLRESPWGTTNGDQKRGLEFSQEQYSEIDDYCKKKNIDWFFSAWDVESQVKMRIFQCPYNKVASAMLGNIPLLEEIASEGKKTFISTGMSTFKEINAAAVIFTKASCRFELMHCNSTYPLRDVSAVNLNVIKDLQTRFGCNVGYSGHEIGLAISLAAVALGATSLERHITLDRTMYGSDQASSVEPVGLHKLVKDVRAIEVALGDGVKVITESEKEVRAKLRYYE